VGTDELTIVVTCAAGATPLERDGMLRRIEEATTEAITDTATRGYMTHGSVDSGSVRLRFAVPGLASPDALAAIADAVTAVLADPDALGWGPFTLDVTQETVEPTPSRNPAMPAAVDEPGTDTRDDDPPWMRVGPRPLRETLRAAAEHVAGLDRRWLTDHGLVAADPTERTRADTEATYVAGALFHAAIVMTDQLFEDLQALTDTGDETITAVAADTDFYVLDDLPARYAHHYGILVHQAIHRRHHRPHPPAHRRLGTPGLRRRGTRPPPRRRRTPTRTRRTRHPPLADRHRGLPLRRPRP
jgi:hypothetical protein